jgi:uncharacterized repeat protein (TIGR03803 family)
MGRWDISRYALISCMAAALLAGCGLQQAQEATPAVVPLAPLRTAASSYQVIYSFRALDGAKPLAGLVEMKGILYGTTSSGGKFQNHGTVFNVTTAGLEHAHSFHSNDGTHPLAGLLNVGGTLYGTASTSGPKPGYRGGTVFSLSRSGNLRVLHGFANQYDGSFPEASLINVKGTLYGTTAKGGTYGLGTVFSVTTNGAEQVLHSFGHKSDGSQPEAGLVDVDGTLYGTTNSGGTYGFGTIFSMTLDGTERVLHNFGRGTDGEHPQAGLVELNGKLYGTTSEGGKYPFCFYRQFSCGTVFSITPSGKETVLHSFGKRQTDGSNPYAGLIHVDGVLYGTTDLGGIFNGGTVFKITMAGVLTVLHKFIGFGRHGSPSNPKASLVEMHGTLYGTTENGGSYGLGAVFALTP